MAVMFKVSDTANPGYEIEITVSYRTPEDKAYYSDWGIDADKLTTALTLVYAKTFQEIHERLGHPPMVVDLR